MGVKRRLIATNALTGINAKEDLQIEKTSGSRSLSSEVITMVWTAIEESRKGTKNKIFLRLCLIYGCRDGELRASRKEDFDFK